jgi:menaquinone-dependent protoporphyrinogen oxidase
MKVLVAVASRHGSTREIGDAIAEVLADSGFEVEVADPDDVDTVEPYGAVILGSSVYVGRWAASARAMVDRCACCLVSRPVWLFSSGPVGTPPAPESEPEEVARIMTRLRARGHRTFPGRLDTGGLGLAERAAVALLQAEQGDFREWADIADWAAAIAAELHAEEIRRLDVVG